MNAIYVNMDSSTYWQSLPTPLEVKNMECGIMELTAKVSPAPKKEVYFCADFADNSVAGNNVMPILRRLKFTQMKDKSGACKKMFNQILWVPIVRTPLNEIRLYITDEEGHLVPFDSCMLTCTLVARKRILPW